MLCQSGCFSKPITSISNSTTPPSGIPYTRKTQRAVSMLQMDIYVYTKLKLQDTTAWHTLHSRNRVTGQRAVSLSFRLIASQPSPRHLCMPYTQGTKSRVSVFWVSRSNGMNQRPGLVLQSVMMMGPRVQYLGRPIHQQKLRHGFEPHACHTYSSSDCRC
jgi:hypothetical protein